MKQSKSGLRIQRIAEARARGTHTSAQWWAITRETDYRCVCCGEEYVVKDHIVSVSRGGSEAIENMQPLCIRCNQKKGTKTTNYLAMWREARRETAQ